MKRNKISLSHYRMQTFDMGELVPVGCFEVLPGDTIQHATNNLLRTQPLLAPPMHPVDVRIHHWFVPYRLIWQDFEKFITGGPTGTDASVYPTITPTGGNNGVGTLLDYLGIPTGTTLAVSALPFRAYAKIWNENYRDEDLETELTVSVASGADSTTNTTLQNCDWSKDYFTAARPWEQKGTAVTVPLAGTAPVIPVSSFPTNNVLVKKVADGTVVTANATLETGGGIGRFQSNNLATPAFLDPNGTLLANLAASTGVSINALRQAFALQSWAENRARFGSRYTEYLRAMGVQSSDGRLDRAEYLGGGTNTIQFSEVLQTAADGTNPVGTMRGHGIAAMRSNRYRRFFEEHGVILTLMSVRPKSIYTNGLPRMFNRRTRFDFFQPELATMGAQAVLNKEVYVGAASPDNTFGYSDRYAEYRSQPSQISGEFRSTLTQWHFARSFGAEPALNASFVKCVPPENAFPVPASDVIWNLARHQIHARRIVPAVSQPGGLR